MSGYWATGRISRATSPPRTMTMEMTQAKTGRSMKKRANMARPPCYWEVELVLVPRGEGNSVLSTEYSVPLGLLASRGEGRTLPVLRGWLLARVPRLAVRRARPRQRGHRRPRRTHGESRPHVQ